MKSLLIPGVCLLAAAVLLQTGLLVPGMGLVSAVFYGALIAGLLLALRFHSSRIFLALVVLFLAQQAVSYFSSKHIPGGYGTLALAVGVLVPLDFVVLSFAQERGIGFRTIAPAALFLFIESVIVAVVSRPEPLAAAQRLAHHAHVPESLPIAVQLCFSAAAIILLVRYALFRKPAESGMLWALAAVFLALRFGGAGRVATTYFAAAAIVLAGAVVETSYLLAYHDELTTLPSRRAFNDALLRLVTPYSIAMVDIDHFKRCNDTYGHDTGDQVLCLVASKLARVAAGGQAYRCGGEEFAILFPGKTTQDVLEHLEDLRCEIEASRLRLRGPDRRQESRGPDRRSRRTAGRGRSGDAIRQLSRPPRSSEISVTVSMGVATAKLEKSSAQEVIQAADKALYRAKGAGRNRVETASAPRGRFRTTTAGIA
ncbi:MAG: GGDEF domain-containing protein [Candidatus Sulfotelmatobacter sp.]